MTREMDSFVSCTTADRARAEWIAWQLEAEGYRVVAQAWDFGAGCDWVHESGCARRDEGVEPVHGR